jgi:hypothetical protein
MTGCTSAQAVAEKLARDFLERVWGPGHDLGAIDELMTPDGRPIEFHGISVWSVRDGRLTECWIERGSPV